MPVHEKLIVFTRYPQAGVTKTRLIPVLGPQGAADLQRRMTAHVMTQAQSLAERRAVRIEVRFEGGSEKRMQDWLGIPWDYRPQGGGNIGARMHRALAGAFREGAERGVLIGSDIPDIRTSLLQAAFDHLQAVDMVLGPATDGGYYLIGIRRGAWHLAGTQLFDAVPWGTDRVLAVTREKIDTLGLGVVLLEPLSDVDRPEDLPLWQRCDQ
ncbi:MAG: TIGR04282 family arsenosugar biosynthesis glycosyltransferase [Desulfobacterales bacterium]|nr:TIGR04282 family arsenosugar biosynthesis glycosyltransferase [Desulfobacterales bacterium]